MEENNDKSGNVYDEKIELTATASMECYCPSKHLSILDKNCGNTLILLMLGEKIENIDFTNEDKEYYKKLVQTWYPEDKNLEMKERLKQVLKEQSIVSTVSNWEGYFLSKCEDIFTDTFLSEIYRNENKKFVRFLKDFNNIKRDFDNMFPNVNQFEDLEFANHIKNDRKINFQNTDHVKNLLKLYDIDIVFGIDKNCEKNWTGIVEFIHDRHKLVHEKHKPHVYDDIMSKYSEEYIKNIIDNMEKLMSKIDYKLHEQFLIKKVGKKIK